MSSLVLVFVAGLLLVFLVPYLARRRQQLRQARTDDRFSADLRVLTRLGDVEKGITDEENDDQLKSLTSGARRGHLLTQAKASEPEATQAALNDETTRKEPIVNRPYGAPDITAARAADQLAQLRAELVEVQHTRAKAARRRAILTGALLICAIGGWVGAGAGLGLGAIVVGGVATGLTGVVLGLGRRAVVVGKRADAARARQITDEERRVQATAAYATRRRHATTEVADFADIEKPAQPPALVEGATKKQEWTPTPIPRPTYTLKAESRRAAPHSMRKVEATSAGTVSLERDAVVVSKPASPSQEIVSAVVAGIEAEQAAEGLGLGDGVGTGPSEKTSERSTSIVPKANEPAIKESQVGAGDLANAATDTATPDGDGVTTLSSLSVGKPSTEAFTQAQLVAQQSAAKAAKEAARRVGMPTTVRSKLDLNAILERRRVSGE